MPNKQSKKGDALINEWLILRNSTIIFPFASRARSEARVMSNHCQQPNATGKKSDDFTNISIHCFDTGHSQELSQPATLNGMLDLAQALGLPSSRERNPTSPGLAPFIHIYYLLCPQTASEIKQKNQEREGGTKLWSSNNHIAYRSQGN